jgi:hypothetical protein
MDRDIEVSQDVRMTTAATASLCVSGWHALIVAVAAAPFKWLLADASRLAS